MTHTKKVLDHGFVTLRNIAGPTRRDGAKFDASDVMWQTVLACRLTLLIWSVLTKSK